MTAGEVFENAINHWRDAKGIGTALIPAPLNDKLMVLGVLQRVYARSPTCKTIIVTPNFNERQLIIDYLTQQPDSEENNTEFKKYIDNGNIKVFTLDYVLKSNSFMCPFLYIFYHLDRIDSKVIEHLSNSKFKLVVINKLLDNPQDMVNLYKTVPLLSDFKQNEINEIRLSTPVEEYRIPIDIPENSEDYKLLNYYNEYISTSLNIFGSFDIMNQANIGNNQLNVSSYQICATIALENGWNDHLDMNIEFNQEIDRLYNPANLKDRATMTYEIIRNRGQLLSDYKGKLDTILDIVNSNPNKKILIINKRADFASIVNDYINNLSETNICCSYHDKLENIPAIDFNGNPVYYKTGTRKGERKFMGSKAQKTLAETLFNTNKIRVLSTNNAPDKDLNISVDIIIITSPMCESITSYIYRLSKLYFASQSVQLYSLYCRNTQEEKLLENKDMTSNHNVKNLNSDENNSDFVVVD